jgi:hypothetical protein
MEKLDLIGAVFGKLKVISQAENKSPGITRWLCLCDCGNKTVVQTQALRREPNGTKSCGCINKTRHEFKDISGEVFGRLTVTSFSHHHTFENGKSARYWDVKCSCGIKKKVQEANLYNKQKPTLSCGCWKKESPSIRAKERNCSDITLRAYYMSYKNSVNNDNKRHLRKFKSFDLDQREFKEIVLKNCFYCDSSPYKTYKKEIHHVPIEVNGIDRIDSDFGYTIDNVVTCCKNCNFMKNELSLVEFKEHIEKIYNFFVKNDTMDPVIT